MLYWLLTPLRTQAEAAVESMNTVPELLEKSPPNSKEVQVFKTRHFVVEQNIAKSAVHTTAVIFLVEETNRIARRKVERTGSIGPFEITIVCARVATHRTRRIKNHRRTNGTTISKSIFI